MELVDSVCKRIKLEHSYALICDAFHIEFSKFEEEDPLKISPEDFAIKIENEEDIVIKQEELGDADVYHSVEYINLPSVSPQFGSHSSSNNATLLPDEDSSSCKNESDFLELDNNCDVASKIDPLPVDVESFDMVPKQVFLEFQQNYEKTIRDLKSQNERILSIAGKMTKENTEALQEAFAKASPFDQCNYQMHAKLVNENIKLKEELRASKAKEELLKAKVLIREQRLETTRRSMRLLQLRSEHDVEAKKMYIDEINGLKERLNHAGAQLVCLDKLRNIVDTVRNDLKAQLSTKEVELKRSQDNCEAVVSRLTDLNKECTAQKSKLKELLQAKHAMEIELARNARTRHTLKERSIKLSKEFRELKNNHPCKLQLQETNKELLKSKQLVKELESLLDIAKKKNLYLVKNKNSVLKEEQNRCRQLQEQLVQARQELSAVRALLRGKIKELKNLSEELKIVSYELNVKRLECKKKEEEIQKKDVEHRMKICEYCGLH